MSNSPYHLTYFADPYGWVSWCGREFRNHEGEGLYRDGTGQRIAWRPCQQCLEAQKRNKRTLPWLMMGRFE